MTGRNWFHLWMRLADMLAVRVCSCVEAAMRTGDHRDFELACRYAKTRRRAIRRADEALARHSMLRVDGGAR